MDLDLDNLTMDYETLFKVSKYYEKINYKYIPLQIYIFLLHILPLVGETSNNKINCYNIKPGTIRDLIGINTVSVYSREARIISLSDNLEVLIYALDNNIIILNEVFYYMCANNILKFVKYLSSFKDINIEYINDELFKASYFGHIETIKYLLNKYTYEKDILSKSLVDFVSNDIFFDPKKEKYLEIVDLFIKKGADVRFNNDEALQKNLKYSRKLENIKYLLDLNANPNNIPQETIYRLKKNQKYDILELLEQYKK